MYKTKKLKEFLSTYSFVDLARSFFILNIWLPNVASPTKSQFLYVFLESIFDQLSKENQIKYYKDFENFSQTLLSLVPAFPLMEDYIPENDWGEIKYYFKDKFFKIFYGGNLSNTYDFYYSFEIVHMGFEDFYINKIRRSPTRELEFCLNIQNEIINGIDKTTQQNKDVHSGDLCVPTETFWIAAINFLEKFNPTETFNKSLVSEYTKDLDIDTPKEIPSKEEFSNRAHDGKNCFYFFVKKDGKVFPVLPRNHLAVLYDKWGKILYDNYSIIEKEVKNYELKIGLNLLKFACQRVNKKELFCFVSAIKEDLKPHKTIFTIVFRSKNKLVLIFLLPPPSKGIDQQKILDTLVPEFQEAQKLLSISPTKIILRGERQIAQFESIKKDGESLEPLFLTVIPHTTTDCRMIRQPVELAGEIIGLDQLLGIFDEIDGLDEFAEFFEYADRMRHSFHLSPMTSYLDKFGSFKDSNSVLIPGASTPDSVMLDPHWGSSFRYRSLSQFWSVFPNENFFGHPRSWSIDKKALEGRCLLLKSKTFLGYVYPRSVGEASVFINSPVDSLSSEQVEFADLMMGSLADSIKVYQNILQQLPFAKDKEKVQVLFFPLSLVKENKKFDHLTHLIPETENWAMDIRRLGSKDYGIRVVYDDEKLVEALNNAKDRTIQIELLVDVLKQVNIVFGDSGFAEIEHKLNIEKNKKNRFRFIEIKNPVSFPKFAQHIIPETRELRLADKAIAQIAHTNNIFPDDYESEEAKEKIDLLKAGLIRVINEKVNGFDIITAIPKLISNIDALTNESEWKNMHVKNSIDQEVDYQREVFAGKSKQYFLNHHKNYSYLIEKFVQLQPNGNKDITFAEIRGVLGLVARLLKLYTVSDFLHYGIFPAKVTFNSDFLPSIKYKVDIHKMQKDLLEEQAKLDLGIIGNSEDHISLPFKIDQYLEELDQGFRKELGFDFKDMINLQQALSLWPAYNTDSTVSTYYKATAKEISEVCTQNIKGFDSFTTEAILKFLTLDQDKILVIEDDDSLAPDLPVWEYRKRSTRYSIRPLVKIGNDYYWGPHSVERSARIWLGITSAHRLPTDIKILSVAETLKKGHEALEKALQEKTKEIVNRFTSNVEPEVFPRKLGFCSEEVGDIDVFAWFKEKNILLNIESKIIDQAFCNKDLKRISEKIFGRIKTTDRSFEKGYLQRVEKRAALLNEKWKEMVEKYWDTISTSPKVISIFVTQEAYWWTKYPPLETNVHFVEIQLLEDFLKNILLYT